jgi:APA family basic amino acid/polyamine antiporter
MDQQHPTLRRALTLPLLVFYGVGVTVGAGIFALIGEILALAGDAAAMSFLLAGLIAGVTGLSYALLVRVFPRAGGEAVFVHRGLGAFAGRLAGFGVVATAIVSSAVIAKAFAGYAVLIVPLPQLPLAIGIVVLLSLVAMRGVRESVYLAAAITLLELGTLAVIALIGLPQLGNLPPVTALVGFGAPGLEAVGFAAILSGAVIAFFAFIGFEDIENMAEETVDPARTAPAAIYWTLGITVLVYVTLALIAVSMPDRAAIAGSGGPMAEIWRQLTGRDPAPVAAVAAIAMVNGILVQIVMAARVLYGMAGEELIPQWFGAVHPVYRTPVRATALVCAVIVVLAASFPLVRLAEATSFITLLVFGMVNLALVALGSGVEHGHLRKWRALGLAGAALCAFVIVFQIAGGVTGGH